MLVTPRACLCAVLLLALHGAFSCAVAQSPAQESSPPKSDTVSMLDFRPWLEAVPLELKDPTTAAAELCEDKPGEQGWLSHVRAGIYRTLCSSAASFDGFFGNARFDDEYQAVYGSVAVGAAWDERGRWDPSVRFRARVRLPGPARAR